MVDDKPAADDPARPQPSRRAKRQPPTIEGSAKDITKDITNEAEAAAAAARAADEAAKASQESAPAASAAETPSQAETPSATFQPESARDFIARDAQQHDTPPDSAADMAEEPAARGRARTAWSETFSATGLAAGLAGGLVVSLVLFALWLTGMVSIRYAGTTAMRARVSVLEMQLNELGSRPVVRNDAFEALSRRVAEQEKAFAALKATPANDLAKDPALAQRLDAAENAMKSVGVALAALSTRVDGATARADSAEKAAAAAAKDATAIDRQTIARDSAADAQLAARIAVLEKSVSDLAAARNAETVDRAARRALAVLALREAALSGEAYDAELKAASALGVDKAALAKLEPLAASGVPGAAALARDLTALVPALRAVQTSDTPQQSGTGFLDRLEANAAKLVRVRPVGSASGSDPQAVIGRVEQHAARGDIAAALADLKSLPPRSRAPADGWIARAEARAAALQASRTLLADTSRAFGSR